MSVLYHHNTIWLLNGYHNTFRYFNVIGSDPEGRLGEAPPPELREHGRISGACFDAALGIIPGLKVHFPTITKLSVCFS
jgi:UDP-glucose 4-epimerase